MCVGGEGKEHREGDEVMILLLYLLNNPLMFGGKGGLLKALTLMCSLPLTPSGHAPLAQDSHV